MRSEIFNGDGDFNKQNKLTDDKRELYDELKNLLAEVEEDLNAAQARLLPHEHKPRPFNEDLAGKVDRLMERRDELLRELTKLK